MRAVRGAEIALIFQEPMTALNPVFTVGDQIAEALLVHGPAGRAGRAREAVELLDAVRIPDAAARARDYPHQLSGGMRQRVLIAIALACKPSLLIADEPTTALDVTIQAQILDLLRELKAELGLSLLLITHDLGVVAETADRVAVMYAGRIVEEGPVDAIFASPQHPYTRGLLASGSPEVSAGKRPRAIDGTVPRCGPAAGCAFEPRCPSALTSCRQAVPALVTLGDDRAARCVCTRQTGTLGRRTALLEVRNLVKHFARPGVFATPSIVKAVDDVQLRDRARAKRSGWSASRAAARRRPAAAFSG